MACAAAGVAAAVVSVGLANGAAFSTWGTVILATINLSAMGFAIAYGWQALLNRVANRSLVGAATLAQTLGCAALAVWIGEPVAEHLVGRLGALVLLGLFLLAMGGALIIHEPDYSPARRRVRLCAVFASIGAMVALFALWPPNRREGTIPDGARRATRSIAERPAVVVEYTVRERAADP